LPSGRAADNVPLAPVNALLVRRDLQTLALQNTKTDVQAPEEGLNDPNPFVQAEALDVLGEEAEFLLNRALNDDDSAVKEAAAQLLQQNDKQKRQKNPESPTHVQAFDMDVDARASHDRGRTRAAQWIVFFGRG
jgi:single-stranded DNA-specific DHH superfamily exonuclease